MSDEDTIFIILQIIAFFIGLLLIASGFSDLGRALSLDTLLTTPLDSLSGGGTGTLKIIVGVVFVIAVIAPNALRVVFER